MRYRSVFVISALVLLAFVVMSPSVLADQSSASQSISSAKQQLLNCYDAAKQAEAAGANITALTNALNDAGALLDQANHAYSVGDFDGAQNFAQQSQNSLSGFIAEAGALKTSAAQQGSFDFWVYFVGSIVGAIAVVCVSAVIWVWNSRRSSVGKA